MSKKLRELDELTEAELAAFAASALVYLRELDNNFDGVYELRDLVDLANQLGVTDLPRNAR